MSDDSLTDDSSIFATSGSVDDEKYLFCGGTSMATPLVAGSATLVRQFYTDIAGITPVDGETPSAALIKATLINGANDMAGQYDSGGGNDGDSQNGAKEPIPNEHEGWGRVNLVNSIFPSGGTGTRIMRFEEETVGLSNTLDSKEYWVIDGYSLEPLKITLAWTAPPANPSTNPDLVNDLDLIVTDPSGFDEYYGNDLENYGWSYPRPPGTNNFDTVNTVENVYIKPPISGGRYTIKVEARNIDPSRSPQPYALVISYGQASKTINLYEGDNFISLPLEPDRPQITEVLRSIDGKYSSVKYYDASEDDWKDYVPTKPDSMNDLWYLYPYMGFWVTVPEDMTLTVYGAHFTEDHDILLYDGWNDVGYPALSAYARNPALAPLIFGDDIEIIYWYDTQSDTWYALENPTNPFEVGKGYSMYCNYAQRTWTVKHNP